MDFPFLVSKSTRVTFYDSVAFVFVFPALGFIHEQESTQELKVGNSRCENTSSRYTATRGESAMGEINGRERAKRRQEWLWVLISLCMSIRKQEKQFHEIMGMNDRCDS